MRRNDDPYLDPRRPGAWLKRATSLYFEGLGVYLPLSLLGYSGIAAVALIAEPGGAQRTVNAMGEEVVGAPALGVALLGQLLFWGPLVLMNQALHQVADGHVEHGSPRWADAVPRLDRLPRFLAVSLLQGAAMFAGLMMCFIGYFPLSGLLTHAGTLVAARGLSVGEALGLSAGEFSRDAWLAMRWELCMLGVGFLGNLLLCGLGAPLILPLIRIGQVVAVHSLYDAGDDEDWDDDDDWEDDPVFA